MKAVNVIQGSPEWHAFRKEGIGGSDAPVVSGDSPYQSQRGLYLLKRGEAQEDESGSEFIFAKGHKTEGLIRQQFQELTGVEMAPLCLIHPEFDHIRASLDGFDGGKFGVLEAKLVGKGVLEDARDEGIIPRHHFVQIQHNMEVAGVDLAQWFGHNGKDNGILIEVKRDAKFIREQLQREHDFWGMVKEGKLPPLSAMDVLEPQDTKLLAELLEAKILMDNAEAYFNSLKEKLDAYGHPRLRGGGITATKSSRQGSIDYKKIPGVATLIEGYTERYKEKFRSAPSKESWSIRVESISKKAKVS